MSVNNRLLYLGLQEEIKVLEKELGFTQNDPYSDFDEKGWEKTREAVRLMEEKLDELEAIKGNRKTPQLYRPIYHRATTAVVEAQKVIDSIENDGKKFDYEAGVKILRAKIEELQTQRNSIEDVE